MIGLRQQLTARVRQGLVPVMGGSTENQSTASTPQNPQAYDLFLRSLAVGRDPIPNKDAIKMLEQVVAMDPTYASAWANLARRYYYDAQYSDGGAAAYQRSESATERAIELDPNMVEAAGRRVVDRTESGHLNEAYDEAREILKRRPDSGSAHFFLAYVYTYGGALEDGARECDAALALDPNNYGFRSCSFIFMESGKYDRALDYLKLDEGTAWTRSNEAHVLVRAGKLEESLKKLQSGPTIPFRAIPLLRAFLEHRPETELAALANQVEPTLMADRDPENKYLAAGDLAFSGQHEIALRLLRHAVEDSYCGYPAMDNDPLFAGIRNDPEFAAIRSAGIDCQKKFREHIAAHDTK
jgi:tetratricopeptide (TPR) repeat protein